MSRRAKWTKSSSARCSSANQGQNPARQAAMKAGIPQEKTAWGLNQLCGSGLRAVALGLQQIANGDANIIVAGGRRT